MSTENVLLIAGIRYIDPTKKIPYDDYEFFRETIFRHYAYHEYFEPSGTNDYSDFSMTKIISGGAIGVDSLAARFASNEGIAFEEFLPDWDRFPKIAGFIRNTTMVEACNEAIVFWDFKSKGSKDTIDKLLKAKKQFIVVPV